MMVMIPHFEVSGSNRFIVKGCGEPKEVAEGVARGGNAGSREGEGWQLDAGLGWQVGVGNGELKGGFHHGGKLRGGNQVSEGDLDGVDPGGFGF